MTQTHEYEALTRGRTDHFSTKNHSFTVSNSGSIFGHRQLVAPRYVRPQSNKENFHPTAFDLQT